MRVLLNPNSIVLIQIKCDTMDKNNDKFALFRLELDSISKAMYENIIPRTTPLNIRISYNLIPRITIIDTNDKGIDIKV